ncbi:MAG: membrane protein insertion efficiency factor YidD [Candidatus Eremiobacteraeota bacterium]|nr:membrane protein insertion efficiency factor YidD [Candidatus Eremiobacteraeota bacterium]
MGPGHCSEEGCCSGDLPGTSDGLSGADETAEQEQRPSGLASSFAVRLIEGYQWVSRKTPAVCRFYPTCSEYTRQAIVKYGLIRGGWRGFKRICRCHPFSAGGHDPVD